MILPDVNVLLYAFRPDSPHHQAYRAWLEEVVNGDSAYGMAPQVLASVARIATHPAIYREPSRLDEVMAFADVLMNQPHCQLIVPGPRHWSLFADLCHTANAKGNLIPDAWFAALAIESGCEWISTDGDYKRFAGLKTRSPLP